MDYVLVHHGVKGQKWGVRNGPPYPIQKKKRAWSSKRYSARKVKNVGSMDEVAKTVIPTSMELISLMASYAVARKINNAVTFSMREHIKPETLEKQSGKEKRSESLKRSNPEYPKDGATLNCVNCTVAYELRQRGYDVEAIKRGAGTPFGYEQRYFKGLKTNKLHEKRELRESDKAYSKRLTKKLDDTLASYGNGARGQLAMILPGMGHEISWEVKGGKVKYSDPQNNTEDCSDYFSTFSPTGYRYARLDDLEINDKHIHEAVKNTKKRGD